MCFELFTLSPTISLISLEEISLHISWNLVFVGHIEPNASVGVHGLMVDLLFKLVYI